MHKSRKLANKLGAFRKLENSQNRAAQWVRSLFSIYDSADLIRLDLPWWTYPAIDAVDAYLAQLNGQARVYEYGAGASTVWLSKRAQHVISVEHDQAFAENMLPIFSKNCNIQLKVIPPDRHSEGTAHSHRKGYEKCSFDQYVDSILEHADKFDLIIIDGRARAACLARARQRLNPKGILLFDDSHRNEYRDAITSSGLVERRLRGLAPSLPLPSQTSLLSFEH